MFSLRNIILTVLAAVLLAEVAAGSYFVVSKLKQKQVVPVSTVSTVELDQKLGKRPEYCESITASATNLSPGEATVVTLSSNTPVNEFFLAATNLDGITDPNMEENFVCVDEGSALWACPNGGRIHTFPSTDIINVRNSTTINISYEELAVVDRTTGNIPTSYGLYGQFKLGDGRESQIDANCMIKITLNK